MLGIQAAFKEINELGGVWGGKKLKLYSVDDGYEPARCVNNTIDLLNNKTIFGFIGFMGRYNNFFNIKFLKLIFNRYRNKSGHS